MPTSDLLDPILSATSLQAWIVAIRAVRFHAGVRCPRCRGTRIHRWGTFAGRQRYRCVEGCGRTFSDFTGTPAAYIKKLDRWPALGIHFAAAHSVRATASALGVHPSTAFRWRHRLLATMHEMDAPALLGRIEVGVVRMAENCKGSRFLTRTPRRQRQAAWEWWSQPKVSLALAYDRVGGVAAVVLRGGRGWRGSLLNLDDAVAWLGAALPEGGSGASLVVSGGGGLDWRTVSSRIDAELLDRQPDRLGLRGCRHLESYRYRLARWLARFRGVASRYLEHYLVWHRRVDATVRHHPFVVATRWSA